jgi:hypothetical protein
MASQRYWAFLSYSSKDAALVKKLHARLETYRVPRDLIGRPGLDEPIPAKLFPVFRDRDELPLAADLGATIQDALAASRYLIVICSRHSARSQWVNEEIRYFKSIGRANRILALIIDGEPHASHHAETADNECFPQALRFHVDDHGRITDQPTEPIAGDLRPGKDGWELAFLKCIAGITGCGLNALTAREKKRSRRRRCILAAAGLLFSAGVVGWWDYTRTKVDYFAEISTRFGVPEGYGSLTKDQVHHREFSYKIESSRRKVRQIICVHSSGAPVDRGDFDSAIQELKFGEDGSLQEVIYRNPARRITARRIFSALKDRSRIIEFKSEHDDSPLALSAKDLSLASGASMAAHTEITAQRESYREDGALVEVRFLSSWREPRADPDGVFGMRYEYGASLLPEKITNLDANGNPVNNRRGFAVVKYRRHVLGLVQEAALFDELGNAVMEPQLFHCYRFEFDTFANRIGKTFFDESLQPLEAALGFHRMVMNRSPRGDCLKTSYYDRAMKPVMSMEGYHAYEESYDDKGRVTATRYFDTEGNPATNQHRVHEQRSSWDDRGNELSRAFFDVKRMAMLGGEYQVHREEFTYDTLGQLASIAHFDVDQKPMIADGFVAHRVEFTMNSLGRMQSWANFDTKGKAILGAENESVVRLRYDQRGNVVEMANFDATGKAFDVAGFHRLVHTYNERGLRVSTSHWAADGKPGKDLKGIHREEITYDERGQTASESFFGTDQSAATDLMGVHRYLYQKDDRGNVLEERCYGPDHQLTASSNGVFIRRYRYNHEGKTTSTRFFDKSDRPMLSKDGFHEFRNVYDSRGNVIETAYYGINAEAVLHHEMKVYATQWSYDSRNRANVERYLDVNRKPMLGGDTWHERRYEFDLRGNIIATSYFGANLQPIDSSDGVHLLRVRHDEKNRITEKRCYGANGQPTLCDAGWHRYSMLYGQTEDTEETSFYGVSDEPIRHPRKQWHRERIVYGNQRETREVSYFDTDGKPGADAEGVHRYFYRTFMGNDVACNYYDTKGNPRYLGDFCAWERDYNTLNQLLEIRWYDEDHEPAPNSLGVYRQKRQVMPDQNQLTFSNFDGQGKPMRDKDGVHRWQQTTDESQRIIEIRYFDPNGYPAKDRNGVHRVNNTYDNRGNLVKKEFRHASGNPALVPAGHAGYVAVFDDNNLQISHTWMGDEGKPVGLQDQIARWTARYDAKGREIERRFFDHELKPSLGMGGHHIRRSTFDEAGNEIDRSFYGIDESAIEIENDLHRWTARYNARGQLLEKSLFNAQGQPICHPEGHHRFVYTYDDRGNRIRDENFGSSGEAILWKGQYHRVETTYDVSNRMTSESFFGIQQEPVENGDGYHKLEKSYDENDRPNMLRFSDREGKQPTQFVFRSIKISYYLNLPLVEKKSYFDSDGKLLDEKKFDIQGNPME